MAVTFFSFPPDKGNVGTAAYLNVFGSIYETLISLKKQGYDVGEGPESVRTSSTRSCTTRRRASPRPSSTSRAR